MARTGSIKSMGLQAYLDTYYEAQGGYKQFDAMMRRDPRATDDEVATQFKRHRITVRDWRLAWEDHQ